MADTKTSAETVQATLAGAKMRGANSTPLDRAFPGYAFFGEKGADVAGAGTITLGDDGDFFHITGSSWTCTDVDFTTAKDGRGAWLYIDGTGTFTHNGTTLQCPGNVDLVVAAGDRIYLKQDNGDNIIIMEYRRGSIPPNSGLVKLAAGTISNQAALNIVLTGYTNMAGLLLKMRNVLPVTDNTTLTMKFSTDGGSSYIATGYKWGNQIVSSGGTVTENSGADTSIRIGRALGNGAAEGADVSIEMLGQTSTAKKARIRNESLVYNQADSHELNDGGGHLNTAGDVDAWQFAMSSGNLSSGDWTLYGWVP